MDGRTWNSNLKVMNQACLSKLNWKLNSGSDEFWCKVMQGDGEDIDAWSQVWIEEGLRLDQQLNIPSHMLFVRPIMKMDGMLELEWETPERGRAFMWMAMHNRLITNSLKSKMGLCHAMCSHSGDVEETTLHVLRDCPKAMNVWFQLIPVHSRGLFFMGETQQWFSFNLKNSVPWSWSNGWCEFWAVTCRCLWSWRNKELFEEDFARPLNPVHVIMQKVKEYGDASRLNGVMAERSQRITMIPWNALKEGFIKLNTDGACS
ncbi:ribonuclease H protein [Trifolium medium]|uniref:Ribonuclease H protein n=1 Tax=Trifolium medium TaxID=97028 RepID=A0A392MV17_9FABA|nr:ribonuclease H protein [Trifolium medium]